MRRKKNCYPLFLEHFTQHEKGRSSVPYHSSSQCAHDDAEERRRESAPTTGHSQPRANPSTAKMNFIPWGLRTTHVSPSGRRNAPGPDIPPLPPLPGRRDSFRSDPILTCQAIAARVCREAEMPWICQAPSAKHVANVGPLGSPLCEVVVRARPYYSSAVLCVHSSK